LANKQEPRYAEVRTAIKKLIDRQERLLTTTQNFAEFCNVATRPVANNGFGRTTADALQSFEHEVASLCTVLSERDAVYAELKRLIKVYNVVGKQVHDARLVAMMLVWQVVNILTLNDHDFRRYEAEGIRIVTPQELVATS
jgi:predicted nucleic acid-binding protein